MEMQVFFRFEKGIFILSYFWVGLKSDSVRIEEKFDWPQVDDNKINLFMSS